MSCCSAARTLRNLLTAEMPRLGRLLVTVRMSVPGSRTLSSWGHVDITPHYLLYTSHTW